MTEDDDPGAKITVEELTLDELRDDKDDKPKDYRGRKVDALRGGGLGPNGSRYQVPERPMRRTWKPLAIALVLFFAAFFGIFNVVYQLTLESQAEGNFYTLEGRVLDYDKAIDKKQVPVEGVRVTIEGMNVIAITDEDGRFRIDRVPGGKFTAYLHKRSWNEAVNTKYIGLMFTSYPKDNPAVIGVRVTDLSPDRDRPVFEGAHAINAEVIDWPTNSTALLRIHATAFDEDLRDFETEVSHASDTWYWNQTYSNLIEYSFPKGAEQSKLWVKVNHPNGTELARTQINITQRPLGPGGWESTSFPQVSLFVRGGYMTNGTPRTVLVHSNGATEYRYRTNEGAWAEWSAMDLGQAEFDWTPPAAGDHRVHVMTRNATGNMSETANVTISMNDTPPHLSPRSTGGPAVTNETTFDPDADAPFIRYLRPDGTWSAWQWTMPEVLIPIDDSGKNASVTFQAKDRAGNVNERAGTVDVKQQELFEVDDYGAIKTNIRICIPIQAIGVILAFYGGLMAYRRQRPTMVMIGAMGALLAVYSLVGAIIAAVALGLVMFSRDEFEVPGAPPPPEE